MPACRRPDREALESDYRSMTVAKVATKYGVATSTVRSWVSTYGFRLKREKFRLQPGDRIGSWEVVERVGTNRSGAAVWRVKCECGKFSNKATGHIVAAEKLGHACGCRNWTGVGLMSGKYWKGILQKARMRGIAVEIDQGDAWAVFQLQHGRCALTGLELKFGSGQTASLDRKDSSKGYVPGNVQWVHKTINMMKNKLSADEFIHFCSLVVQHKAAGSGL